MPKYLAMSPIFLHVRTDPDPRRVEAGEIIITDAPPGSCLAPLDDAARERVAAVRVVEPEIHSLKVRRNLASLPNTTFRIEFFASTTADASGFGEGQNFLGSLDVTTDATGAATGTGTFTYTNTLGAQITATATNLTTNDTSEFSQKFSVA